MIRPDDEDHSFKARWEALCRILLVEPSVKLVALTAGGYADFQDGTSCRPSNDRICRNTGYGRRCVVNAWAVLRELEMAERVVHAVAHRKQADEYELAIPENWHSLPVLGPREGKFTCQQCGKGFNPPPITYLHSAGGLRFRVHQACFCPSSHDSRTGKCKRPAACCKCAWDRAVLAAGGTVPWGKGEEPWKLFRRARGDDW